MTFVSYAQNLEDVMLWRALKHIEKGFYIDVGANDPMIDSVTLAFYERGWRGVNIEPMRQYFEQLCEKRPEDINLPVAISNVKGTLTFFDIPDTGLSTMDVVIAEAHREAGRTVNALTVPVMTLSDVCAEHVHGPIHFLKIDVEGLEGAVLKGMDFHKWQPWILVVEATRPQAQVTSHGEWERLVLEAGYRFAYFDGLNHYYVATSHLELADAFKMPPNVFDDFNLRVGHAFSYPLTEFQIRIHDAELNAYHADVRTQRAHAMRDDLELRLRDAQQQLAEQHTKMGKTEAYILQIETSEAQLKKELAHIYSTTSWRISAPVRWGSCALQMCKSWGQRMRAPLRAFVKRTALKIIRPAIATARKHPILIRGAMMFRERYPGTWQRIMNRIRPALSASPPSPEAPPPLPGWTGTLHSPFQTMLVQELQKRHDKKSGNS